MELWLIIFLIAAINNVIHRDLIDFFCEIEEACILNFVIFCRFKRIINFLACYWVTISRFKAASQIFKFFARNNFASCQALISEYFTELDCFFEECKLASFKTWLKCVHKWCDDFGIQVFTFISD